MEECLVSGTWVEEFVSWLLESSAPFSHTGNGITPVKQDE